MIRARLERGLRGKLPVNALTGSGYDPITDTAELKVCAVRIEPASGVLA